MDSCPARGGRGLRRGCRGASGAGLPVAVVNPAQVRAFTQAAAGFPHALDVGLPALRLGRRLAPDDPEAARVQGFFAILASMDDTNLLHRGGGAGLRFAQETAAGFLGQGGVEQAEWRKRAARLERARAPQLRHTTFKLRLLDLNSGSRLGSPFTRDARSLRPRWLSGGLQCGTRTIRRLSEERRTASRRDTQLCRHARARDRRGWHSVPFCRHFNDIAIDDVWRRSWRWRAPESVKQGQIQVSNIAIRRSPKRTDQDALRDRPDYIRANIGQRTNDRHDRARTAAGSRIECYFDCGR